MTLTSVHVFYQLAQDPTVHFVAGRAVSADGAQTIVLGPYGDAQFGGNQNPKSLGFYNLGVGGLYTITLLASDVEIDPDVDFD